MATTTPNYGWDVPTSTDYVKDGATAIETLGDDIDATLWTALGGAYPGLRLVKKQTIGSGVSSVTVTGAFSATYENYKIIVTGGVGSTTDFSNFTLGSTATGYYAAWVANTYANVASNAGQSNGSSFFYCAHQTANGIVSDIELNGPFASRQTYFNSQIATDNTGITGNGYLAGTTSYTAFTLTPVSGTLTGGTIYVYGYGAS